MLRVHTARFLWSLQKNFFCTANTRWEENAQGVEVWPNRIAFGLVLDVQGNLALNADIPGIEDAAC